jgi:hypothetical protein
MGSASCTATRSETVPTCIEDFAAVGHGILLAAVCSKSTTTPKLCSIDRSHELSRRPLLNHEDGSLPLTWMEKVFALSVHCIRTRYRGWDYHIRTESITNPTGLTGYMARKSRLGSPP